MTVTDQHKDAVESFCHYKPCSFCGASTCTALGEYFSSVLGVRLTQQRYTFTPSDKMNATPKMMLEINRTVFVSRSNYNYFNILPKIFAFIKSRVSVCYRGSAVIGFILIGYSHYNVYFN